MAGLLRVESRRAEPLLDPRFFTSIPFSAATLTAVAAFAAFAGFLFLNALYLQDVRGYSPLHAGLLTLPMAAMTAVLPPISGRIVARRGARLPLVIGGVGIAAGGCLLLPLDASTPLVLLFVAYVVFGVGFGLINAPITNAAVSGMPVAQAGVAAGVASTSSRSAPRWAWPCWVPGDLAAGHVVRRLRGSCPARVGRRDRVRVGGGGARCGGHDRAGTSDRAAYGRAVRRPGPGGCAVDSRVGHRSMDPDDTGKPGA